MRTAEKRDEVTVERVPEPNAPKVRVAPVDDPLELDAERRAEQALAVQRDWEPDLRGVTLHDDAQAATAADAIGAAAFTRGNDIYLGREYEAGTPHGDHVLAHELAHVEQNPASDEIHRYPATALTAGPVDWASQTAGVFRPGGGVSGGVYIMTSSDPDGGVAKVVVKPVFGASGLGTKESGESLTFGDQALKELLGINTPASRAVKGGTPEFAQLLALCQAHQPPKPAQGEEGSDTWQPLAAAKSFIVMGEVPNGRSVASLAERAGTDKDAMNALYRSVLDDMFVWELGRICVGDLLIGNDDRMVARAMNLGNVMVSMHEGRSTAWAIDTNAVLGAKLDPKAIASAGSASKSLQGGFSSAMGTFNDTPAALIEGFFRFVLTRMKGVKPPDQGPSGPPSEGPSPVELFEFALESRKSSLISSFELGWETALIDIFALVNTKEGRGRMKALTGEHEDTEAGEDLSYQALKTNAMFLANKATGADNKEAAAEPAALAAAKELAAFNPNDVAFPVDQYYWKAATIPGGAAYSADLEHPSALPEPVKITHVKNNKGGVDQAQLDAIGTAVVSAKAELSALGAKSKGIVKKKEVPRNRALAGTFVADTYLVGAGGVRAGASAAALQNLTEIVSLAAGGGLKPEKAAAAIPAARFVKSYVEILELQLKQYTGALRDDAKAVSKIRKYGQRTQLSKTLNDVATYTDQTVFTRFLNDVKKSDPQALLDSLTEAAKPKAPPVPSREGRPALSGSGRKPLIGSRGKR